MRIEWTKLALERILKIAEFRYRVTRKTTLAISAAV